MSQVGGKTGGKQCGDKQNLVQRELSLWSGV